MLGKYRITCGISLIVFVCLILRYLTKHPNIDKALTCVCPESGTGSAAPYNHDEIAKSITKAIEWSKSVYTHDPILFAMVCAFINEETAKVSFFTYDFLKDL